MKQLLVILILFTVSFGYSQNDNPYAKFGYNANTIKTPQERMDYMLIIPNRDTISSIKKIGIEPNKKKYYLFGKDDEILIQEDLSKEELARFLIVDPLAKDYPHNSTYAFAENDIIRSIELEGLEKLIVHNINQKDRKANMTIKKTALIVQSGLNNITQHGKFSSKALNSIFTRGNRTLVFKDLPQNGIKPEFVSGKEWRKGSAYKVKVDYDVNIKFVTASNAKTLLASDPELYSIVTLGKSTDFSSKTAAGRGDATGNRNGIRLNPSFFGTTPTSPLGEVNGKIYANANEVLGHELGIHNMAGQVHQRDPKTKKAIYPSYGLGAQSPGNVYPLEKETKGIIQLNNSNIKIKK